MDSGTSESIPGRVPLAVVVVGSDGLVTHWSSGARKLFGPGREEAVGSPAADLMPVYGALGDAEGCTAADSAEYGLGRRPRSRARHHPPRPPGYARAGRARSTGRPPG
ncbi:hypothetical protein GCM10020000_15340 [Streptomyces olivoverticillatus]